MAVHLRDDCKALEEPQADLDRLDRAIADAEGRYVQWSEQLAPDSPFADPMAQATDAYTSLRMPHLNFVLPRNRE